MIDLMEYSPIIALAILYLQTVSGGSILRELAEHGIDFVHWMNAAWLCKIYRVYVKSY